MIFVSHVRRILFIHVIKTAGTSILTGLAKHPALFLERELLKRLRWLKRFPNPANYHKHVTAEELKAEWSSRRFDSFFKFAFVRNPWDWNVSVYHYICQDTNHWAHEEVSALRDFEEFVASGAYRLHRKMQKDFVTDGEGRMLMDFVGRYENLQEDFNQVCDRAGIRRVELPKLNSSRHKPYRECYNSETRDIIAQAYKEDIELFDYEF